MHYTTYSTPAERQRLIAYFKARGADYIIPIVEATEHRVSFCALSGKVRFPKRRQASMGLWLSSATTFSWRKAPTHSTLAACAS